MATMHAYLRQNHNHIQPGICGMLIWGQSPEVYRFNRFSLYLLHNTTHTALYAGMFVKFTPYLSLHRESYIALYTRFQNIYKILKNVKND